MRLVGDFLKKFNTLTPPNDSVKKELVQVLKRVAGVSVTLKQVAVKKRYCVYIQLVSGKKCHPG